MSTDGSMDNQNVYMQTKKFYSAFEKKEILLNATISMKL